MSNSLSPDQIAAILAKGSNVATKSSSSKSTLRENASSRQSTLAPQVGPLRWHDTPRSCASRNCGSQTFVTVQGIPNCMVHALRRLNELYVQLEGKNFDGPSIKVVGQ